MVPVRPPPLGPNGLHTKDDRDHGGMTRDADENEKPKKQATKNSCDNHTTWSRMSPDQMCDCVRIRSGCQCLQFLPRPQTHDMMVAGVLLMMRMMILVVHAECRMNLYKLLRHRGQAPETQPTYQSAMHKYTRGHHRGASQPQGSDKVEVKQYQTHPRDRIIPIHHEQIHTGQPK